MHKKVAAIRTGSRGEQQQQQQQRQNVRARKAATPEGTKDSYEL